MIKSEICYDSRDGVSKINALRYEPDNKADVRAVVQIVHGMAEYAERYEEFAEFLTKQGVVVTADDHLGHGKTAQKSGKYGYFCEQDAATVLVRDVHRLKKLTQMEYPDVPYIIMGHSMAPLLQEIICAGMEQEFPGRLSWEPGCRQSRCWQWQGL